jgi:hypothetical protein
MFCLCHTNKEAKQLFGSILILKVNADVEFVLSVENLLDTNKPGVNQSVLIFSIISALKFPDMFILYLI